MAAVTADIASRIAELSDAAFAAFCDDIAGMFGVDMRCDRREAHVTAVRNVREHFKKLTVVHLAKADGALNGTFHLVLDQGGLFVLSGVIVMLPESRILEDVKRGTLENATNMQDAAREAGNLLVGSWDRIFRGSCPGHGHFVKTSTFLGTPWEKPEQIELHADTQIVLVLYDMTIDPYPSFACAAVFPLTVLDGLDQTGPETAGDPEGEGLQSGTLVAVEEEEADEPSVETQNLASPRPAPTPPAPDIGAQDPRVIPPTRRSPAIDAGMLPSELVSAQSGGAGALLEPGLGTPFTFLDDAYIQSRPQAGLAVETQDCASLLSTPVAEIMEKEVVWAGPEDTVQDVIAKMQQHNVGYVLIGSNGVLEGLVSGSNILGAVSVYLRPMFAKWRRPQDDATLGVKVKWIMSRPVRTIRPDATCGAMIESMRRCGGRCLPVVDATGTVQGMVTVFDILLRILGSDKNISWKGRPPQAPALLV